MIPFSSLGSRQTGHRTIKGRDAGQSRPLCYASRIGVARGKGGSVMTTVKEILAAKVPAVCSIHPRATVFDALKLMSEMEIGAVMVIDEIGAVRGILSERDYARKIPLQGKTSRDTSVAEIMTPDEHMHRVAPSSTLEDCMVLMTAKQVRHLPVFDNGHFLGLISIGDVVRAIISEKQSLIDQLSSYIGGKYG
jgi:CBS domain-containing protein